MVRKAKKKLMDEKIYLIDLMNLSNHLHILNYGEFDIIKIGIINTSRNLQTFRLCFSLEFRKKREVIRWQYKGFAKIWENREEMAILKMLENGLC